MKGARSKASSGGTGSNSDEELDDFFSRPPKKRSRVVASSPPASSGPSSELDVLAPDSESSPKPAKKGKGRATKPKAKARAKPLKKAAPEPIKRLYKSASIILDSDEEDDPSGELPVQSTQHVRQNDAELRAMAETRGWKGKAKQHNDRAPPPPSPPPRAKSPAPAPAAAVPARSKSKPDAPIAKNTRDRSTSSDLTASRSSKLVPSTSPSTSPARVAPLPVVPEVAVKDFWGAGTSRPVLSAAKQQAERGKELRAKGAKLESLSFIRKDLRLDESARKDELEIEDDGEDGEEDVPYESVRAKEKRLREEGIAHLQAKRQNKPDPPPPAPQEQCAICDKLVLASTLEAHSISCFEEQQQKQPAAPLQRKPTPTTDERHQRLVNDLAFSPPIPVTAKWDAATKSKGKARAPRSPSPEPVPVPVPDNEDDEFEEFDEFDDDGFDWEGVGQEVTYADEEPQEEEEDDDDEDDVLIDDSWRAPPKVNSSRARGPPVGESPPRGSIYISTLPREMRLGYERMYTLKSAPAAEQPQKMSAPKKYGASGGGGRGKWGAKRGGGGRFKAGRGRKK
ncbi:hypothetical protein RQP46_000529 [Phenoliferia psychrophenolica]